MISTVRMLNAGPARIEVLIDGAGPAVVLVPSSQRDSLHEADFVKYLVEAGLRVLRPQPRGMGRSSGPLENITLSDLAGDIAGTIDACAADGRAVVLGHAFGHTVARVTDLCHPDKVRGVGLLAAASRHAPASLVAWLDQAADAQDSPAVRLRAMQAALFAPGSDASAWAQGWHPHLRTFYRRAAQASARDAWWGVSNSPILDVQGAMDPWRPPNTRRELADVLGGEVTVEVIDGCSHAMLPERPLETARAIASWIATLPP